MLTETLFLQDFGGFSSLVYMPALHQQSGLTTLFRSCGQVLVGDSSASNRSQGKPCPYEKAKAGPSAPSPENRSRPRDDNNLRVRGTRLGESRPSCVRASGRGPS